MKLPTTPIWFNGPKVNEILRAIIIDDEIESIEILTLIIQKFIKEVQIIATSAVALEGIKFIDNYQPDIVFLDINMPELDGFEVLQNTCFKQFSLIFTTAHSEHGLKALKSGAVDYLLKPVDIQELQLTVERIKRKHREPIQMLNTNLLVNLMSKGSLKIAVPTKNSVEYILAEDIISIEADDHCSKVTLVNLNREIISLKALKDYEPLLCRTDKLFIRLHKSFIVNINFVLRYLKEDGGYILTQNNKRIPISKTKKKEFLRAINVAEQVFS